MSRMIVLGAGIVGRAAAWDLARRGHEILVADADPGAAAAVGTEFGVAHTTVDAGDGLALTGLFEGSSVVVSAVPYGYGKVAAAAAVTAGCHYLDFGGNPAVVAEQVLLDSRAREAGVAIVPDCGLAPGFANVLAVGAVESLDPGPIECVHLRVGGLPVEPQGALQYQLAFSPGGLINEYAEPCEVLRHGRYAVRQPLTGFEEVDWPGWGPLEAFHTAGGSSSLARMYQGRVSRLDYKTLRYPGHGRIFKAMAELGLFEDDDAAGSGTSPRAVLLAALAEHLPRAGADIVLVRCWAAADRNGERAVAGYQVEDRHDGRFSAMARTTAWPATALAHLLATGALAAHGAATMDATVKAALLLPELDGTGIMVEEWSPSPARS